MMRTILLAVSPTYPAPYARKQGVECGKVCGALGVGRARSPPAISAAHKVRRVSSKGQTKGAMQRSVAGCCSFRPLGGPTPLGRAPTRVKVQRARDVLCVCAPSRSETEKNRNNASPARRAKKVRKGNAPPRWPRKVAGRMRDSPGFPGDRDRKSGTDLPPSLVVAGLVLLLLVAAAADRF